VLNGRSDFIKIISVNSVPRHVSKLPTGSEVKETSSSRRKPLEAIHEF